MKRTKIAIGMLFIILLILLVGMSYYLLFEVESKVPEEMKETFEIKQEEFMERNIFIISPKNGPKTEKTILYLHGGSYMAEASQKHWELLKKIVEDTKATIIMPDYPLAPKYNYKDVFEIMIPFYKELINKVDVNNLILMGDSAGGGLGLAIEEKIGEESLPMPSKTIFISPWLDVRLQNSEIEEYEEKDKVLNKDTLKLAGITYAGSEGINSYLVNPIDGDLLKLKNITIFIGTNDILNPDTKLLKEKAQEKGIRRTNSNKRI